MGMLTARAVSITRSTSIWLISLSLIATMPCELKLRMWLPRCGVDLADLAVRHQLGLLQRALDGVDGGCSILTTTPRRKTFRGFEPMR